MASDDSIIYIITKKCSRKHGQRFLISSTTRHARTKINRARWIIRCAEYVRMNIVLLGKHKRHDSLR
jgi:hypothetical protein